MQKLIERLKVWWADRDKRRLQKQLMAVAMKDAGYAQADVPLDCSGREEQVLRFLNSQIAKSRRPYGFSLYIVSLSCASLGDIQKPPRENFLSPFDWNAYWDGDVREQIQSRIHAFGNAPNQVLRVAVTSGGDLLKSLMDDR
jgi:hypothetical protein